MTIKETVKKIPGVEKINKIRKTGDFKRDRRFFTKHSFDSNRANKKALEYKIITELHKLEKGFCATEMRPFGTKKISAIINCVKRCEKKYGKLNDFTINYVISAFETLRALYREKEWTGCEQYKMIVDFLDGREKTKAIQFGAEEWQYNEENILSFKELERFILSRKSTRAFSDQKVTSEEMKKAVNLAAHSPSACNRQPIKAYFVSSKENKETLIKILPGLTLFEMNNVNLLLITFDMAFALFAGERNQGWFNAGLFSMNLANILHSMGIGTCFLQYGEEFKTEAQMKKTMNIPESERVAAAIACGHYKKTNKALYSARKPIEDVYREI